MFSLIPRGTSAIKTRIPNLFADPWFTQFDRAMDSYLKTDLESDFQVLENKEMYKVQFELPGLKKEDISISIKNGTLEISGTRKVERKEEEKLVQGGLFSGTVHRRITISDDVQTDKVSAEFENGILTIILPKSEHSKERTVEITLK